MCLRNAHNLLILYCYSYIDSGRNPELFTRHQLEQTLSDYEAVQRKVQAYKVAMSVTLSSVIDSLLYVSVSVYVCSNASAVCDVCLLQEFRAELIQQLQKPFEAEIAAYLASCAEEK